MADRLRVNPGALSGRHGGGLVALGQQLIERVPWPRPGHPHQAPVLKAEFHSRRHRAKEFLAFLKEIDARVPAGLDLHIVMDNYATHKTATVKAWLARRPRYHVHFTPTSASWLNQVERWFAELTRKQLRRGVHPSTRQLEADIRAFIDTHNADPQPFKWTKSADAILASVKRFCHQVEHHLIP